MATILIIDDHAANREYLNTLLGYGGHHLLQAADGQEGLTLALAHHPHLVIADILMPTMDGFEFVRRLREEPTIAGTTVIFYTAHYHERETKALAAECGVAHVLTKPAEPEVVIRTVEAALGEGPNPVPKVEGDSFDREHLRLITDKLSEKAEQLGVANGQLSALVDLGMQLGSERDPKVLVQGFCDAAREIIGARFATVGVFANGGSELRHLVTAGLEPDAPNTHSMLHPAGKLFTSVLTAGEAIRLCRASGEWSELFGESSSFPQSSLMAVPVVSPTRVYGWLCLGDRIAETEFSSEDERLAKTLGAQFGRIYENGSLYADLVVKTNALSAAQSRLEHVVSSSPAVLYSLVGEGAELTPTWISPNVTDLLGYTPEEALVPTWWYECLHPDDRESTIRSIVEGIGAHDRAVIDYRLRKRDGVYLWLRGEMRLLRDDGGNPVEILGSWTDITTRVWAELALAERVRMASLNAEIGHWLTQGRDVPETLQHCAESLVRHLGAAFARLWTVESGEHVLELQASAGIYTHLDGSHSRIPIGSREIGQIASERRPYLTNSVIGDDRISDQDWARREGILAFAGYPLIVEDRLVGVMALFARHPLPEATRDALARVAGGIAIGIERKRAEENLQKANTRLEEAMSELRRAQSKIVEQERLRALGEMSSGIAHDFNNALSPIIGFSDLLLEHQASLDNRETLISYLQIIRTAATDAASVVRRLREFYRGRDAADELMAVDLNGLVRQCVELSRPRWRDQAQSRGATIDVSTDLAQIPLVAGEPSHLREAILNLIFNAVDAMPGGGKILLQTSPDPDGGATLRISDNGIGMSDEVRQRCLQPFFTTKGDRGTGLGLSMVYGIVNRHEGSIDIRSNPGQGTTVTMTLPAHRGETAPASPKRSTPNMPSLRILVVDDETNVRIATAAILEADGHHIVEASDGNEALAAMRGSAFDLVVTDRAMPGMSGDQLAEAISSLHPSTRVVMLTGFGDLMYSAGDLPPGVDFVVAKPATIPTLREAVRKATSQA